MENKNRIFLYFAVILFLMSFLIISEYGKSTGFTIGEYLAGFTFLFLFILFRNIKFLKSKTKLLIITFAFVLLLIAFDVLGFWLVISRSDYTQFILSIRHYYFIFSLIFIFGLAFAGCMIKE